MIYEGRFRVCTHILNWSDFENDVRITVNNDGFVFFWLEEVGFRKNKLRDDVLPGCFRIFLANRNSNEGGQFFGELFYLI